MKKFVPFLLLIPFILTACSLAADVTPPPVSGNSISEAAATPVALKTSLPTAALETPLPAAAITTTLSITETATSPITRTVTGWVSFPTGMSQAAGLAVNLIGFSHGASDLQMSSIYTSSVLTDGSFMFSDLLLPEDQFYGTVIRVDGTMFNSELTTIPTDTLSLSLPITVTYTTDLSALSVNRLHMIFDFSQPEVVQVMEIYVISNSGPTVLAAPNEAGSQQTQGALKFSVPQGATDLVVENESLGGRFVATEDGFADTQAVYPGSESYQLSYAYFLPYKSRLDFSMPINLPVVAATVLLSDPGVRLSGGGLIDNGVFEGTEYRRYDASNLSAGSQIAFRLSGKPGAGTSTGENSRANLAIGLGVFGVALIATGAWFFLRSKKVGAAQSAAKERPTPKPAPKENLPAASEDPETLMDAILALDDLYQAGKIPETAYRERREEIKSKLKQAMESSDG